jgi:LemA protein
MYKQCRALTETLHIMGGDMDILWILLVLVGIFLTWVIGIYNNLVQARETVKKGLVQVDVQLKRRHDLIPNLVEAAKGYMAYEKDTLEKVIKSRQIAVNAVNVQDKIQAESALTSALRGFMAIAENYPNLKADQHVLRLQEELTSTENKISLARQQYNEEVNRLNVSVQSFPDSIVALKTGFEKVAFFQLELAEDRQMPLVKF